jgi:predicted N-formylglutamate amidohydrolase
VVDLNRPPDHPSLIPEVSDGVSIPGNVGLTPAQRQERIDRYHAPYHAALDELARQIKPRALVAIHSFTPEMAGFKRPWPFGVLWSQDDRLALQAACWMAEREPTWAIGLNQPYSGKLLNYTMDRHAAGRGLPYLSIEIRQDELETDAGVGAWADRLRHLLAALAPGV